ncbi:alpha/beta hydrolase [Cryptosporangium aurantiacum]|uniref:Pimeloyl-ACP methyl ester carboxylesterase n=1 Tax=Cryptosporangium aurantiacum TaxID=134849 RepID=A0A1M7RGK7_9ACTN|nr:Pimeloyl-ACP methyl ester carboxylesterase [Cryptosporangium aurantiacum]
MDLLLPGISTRRVPTERLTINVLEVERRTVGEPIVFVHGNVSSSLFWQYAMRDLPDTFRPIAVDLRGFGDTDPAPVDATRGLRDFSDDVLGLLEVLELDRVHLVGWSMGGGVVLQLLRDRPELVRTATLINPVSPYGFGGTKGIDGQHLDPPGLGSGAGSANPEFVQRLAVGDRTADAPVSPRAVLHSSYVKAPFTPDPDDADRWVSSMLSTRTGDDNYPGTSDVTAEWPGAVPGTRGVLNTMAPTFFRVDDLDTIEPKPPIYWIRGDSDVIVSDTSLFDLAYLGKIGAVPGWPGDELAPPQPMVAQTRHVLDRYALAGGRYEELVIADTGHSPHIEKPKEFLATLVESITEYTD